MGSVGADYVPGHGLAGQQFVREATINENRVPTSAVVPRHNELACMRQEGSHGCGLERRIIDRREEYSIRSKGSAEPTLQGAELAAIGVGVDNELGLVFALQPIQDEL